MRMQSGMITGMAAILLSTAALADSSSNPANTTPTKPKAAQTEKLADRCNALETQFDQAVGSHGNAAKLAAAKVLRTKGENLCKTSHQANGIKDLQQALKDLGVKPSD